MKFISLRLFFLFGIFSAPLLAQPTRLFRPSLALNYEYVPEAKVQDSLGFYSSQKAELKFFIPLYSYLNRADTGQHFNYFQLMVHGSGAWSTVQLEEMLSHQTLLRGIAGLSGIWVHNRKNIFMLSVNSMCPNDVYTISNPQFRYSGLLQYRRNVNRSFSYHAGLGYSYFIGRGILLPSLGLSFKTGKRSRMLINFPSRIAYVQQLGKKVRLSAYLKPQGGFYYISNKSNYTQLPNEMYLREREQHLGISGVYKLGSNFQLTSDIGLASRRKISLTESLQNKSKALYKDEINSGVYLGLGLKYIFHSRKKDRENELITTDTEKEELLTDPDFYDIIAE